jgi:hypothetical protein
MKKLYTSPVFSFFKKELIRFTLAFLILIFLNAFKGLGQLTYTWNQTGTADWQVAANWTPGRTAPAADDILAFNNGFSTTVINVPTQTIGQLQVSANTNITLQAPATATVVTIGGGVGNDLTVTGGSALNIFGNINDLTISLSTGATGLITGTMDFSASTVNTQHKLLAADPNGIIFNSPAVFTQGLRCTGNVFGNSGASGTIIFNSGTTFIQNGGTIPNSNPFALAAPASKVVFNTGSLYKHQQTGVPSMSGRTYADFELNYATANLPVTGGTATNIDNLTITAGILNLNLTGGVNLKGNISVAVGQTLTFSPAAAGTLTFNGTTPQSITNNGTLTFGTNQDVTINNATGLTLNSNITLNNLITFTSGIITAPNPKVLTLNATASVAGVSNTSFVNGLVRKIGNTAFVFPVGKPIFGYVPIGISAPAVATDAFTAEYVRASAEALGTITATGLDHVSRVDYWNLNRDAGTSDVDVTLNWTSGSSNSGSTSYITDLNSLAVARFNGTNWNSFYHSSGTATGNVTAGFLTWPMVNTFNRFSLASINFANPLPINLNYLNGAKQNNSHNLTWKVTCTNNPTATMSLERSADNRNFTAITTIVADALRCQQPFAYYDNVPLAGINYYRLKMINANGKITYSNPITILNKDAGFEIVGLLPNLIINNAVLNVTAAQKTKMQVVVTDITGRQVQQIAYNLIAGSNQFTINLGNLSAGTYQITGYTQEGKSRTVRFVKQ